MRRNLITPIRFRFSDLPHAQMPEYISFLPEEMVELEVEPVKEQDEPHWILVTRHGHAVCRLRTQAYSILVMREQPIQAPVALCSVCGGRKDHIHIMPAGEHSVIVIGAELPC